MQTAYRIVVAASAEQLDEQEYVFRSVVRVNDQMPGAYIFSCGKNMGVFKACGYPEDVGDFYRLEEYEGYSWTAHGRYPTNTPGWWGGAHPFGLLDKTIVHNAVLVNHQPQAAGGKGALNFPAQRLFQPADYRAFFHSAGL